MGVSTSRGTIRPCEMTALSRRLVNIWMKMICKFSEHHRFGVSWRNANGIGLLVRQTSSLWLSNISGRPRKGRQCACPCGRLCFKPCGLQHGQLFIYTRVEFCVHTPNGRKAQRELLIQVLLCYFTRLVTSIQVLANQHVSAH